MSKFYEKLYLTTPFQSILDKKISGKEVNPETIKLLKLLSINRQEISLWLMASLFAKPNLTVSMIVNKPCKTLMNKGFSFDDITDSLQKLIESKMVMGSEQFEKGYKLTSRGTYGFRCLLNDMDKTIKQHPFIEKISKECGFEKNLFLRFIKSSNSAEINSKKLAEMCVNNAVPFSKLFFSFYGS